MIQQDFLLDGSRQVTSTDLRPVQVIVCVALYSPGNRR